MDVNKMDNKTMEKLVKNVEEIIEYNRKIREHELKDYKLKSRKKYKNVPNGIQEIYVDFQVW